jgi:hypothetical protein
MKLYLDKTSQAHLEIQQRMQDMTLAFQTEEGSQAEIVLEDGSQKFIGEQEATKHLDEIAGELHSWYYCNC